MICRYSMILTFWYATLISLVLPCTHGALFVSTRVHGGRNACKTIRFSEQFGDAAPAVGLYEIEEQSITDRGKLEGENMIGVQEPILPNAPKVKGVGAGGGFGGASGTKKTTTSALKAQAKSHAKVLREDGVVRIDGVLSNSVADDLRNFVFDLRKEAEEDVGSGKVKQLQRFANVLLRKNRCDLTMPLGEEVIYRGLVDSLCNSAVGQTMQALLGKKAVLYEFSCLISDPGSDRQVVHPDTPCVTKDEDPVLYTCFMALQDVRMDMGPTVWFPKTHNVETHDIFKDTNAAEGEESPKDELLRTQPSVLGLLPKGSCAIFDSRLLHCGSANMSDDPRALFYFSFKNPKIGYPGNPSSMRPELQSANLELSTLIKELESFNRGKGCKQLDALAAEMK
mmetsp:Transcript_26201/g.40186  ORF Transcript_26201/g.40186 Transcript_26201/m.40186 type:complete len:396 (-) Transcript_26201:2111-3298(-)